MTTNPTPLSAVVRRTREIAWTDPLEEAAKAVSMTGLEYLLAMSRGDMSLSPIAALLDIEAMQVRPGWVRFDLTPQEFHYNASGLVHGGVSSTLLDSAVACAALSTLEAGRTCATSELKVNFLRPVTMETGAVSATGQVLHVGRRQIYCEAHLQDSEGALLAHATGTCRVVVTVPGAHPGPGASG